MTTQHPISSTRPVSQNGASKQARRLFAHTFGATDQGRKRQNNEDQFVVATLMRALSIQGSSMPQSPIRYGNDFGQVMIVADGMGGVRGGEYASAIAVNAVEDFLLKALRWVVALEGAATSEVLRDFQAALRAADMSVYTAATNDPGLRGMGTTMTLAYSFDRDLFVAHVGDSRCYIHRADRLYQITHDHTLIQQAVEAGMIPPEQAHKHSFRHIITNVVGGEAPGVEVEVHRVHLEPGDTILLCTDGLTGMVSDDQIATVLASPASPQQACESLIHLANTAGGEDNVTAVVARYM
jgi:serine/threonine protein phosphatase PrpC